MGKTNKGDAMRYDIDIFHYIDLYKKEWKKMIFLVLCASLFTAMFQSIQPMTYRSTLIALSSKESGQGANISSYLGLPNLGIGNSSDDIIFSMLKSRRTSNDISEHFDLKKKRGFWWILDTYIVTGGFAVEVKGSDPDLTRDIANFAVENLNKINLELQVTSQKPMVKVLDSALRGTPVRKDMLKKAIASGLFVFLAYTLFIFFREYFSQIKKSKV